jgi:glycosyltransferase involved in cell wall biosynthesis
MLISVIVPTFNAAATLRRTLDSIYSQTYRDFEVLVVDDGSTDTSRELALTYAAKWPPIQVLSQRNSGPMAARNLGIAASSGDVIAPLDSDDIWHPTYLEKMTAELERLGARTGLVYALHRKIDAEDNICHNFPLYGCEGTTLNRHAYVNFIGAGGSATLMRRAAVLEAGCYDPRTRDWGGAEDYLLQLRIAARYDIGVVAEYLVGYREREGSYSDNPLAAMRARMEVVRAICTEQQRLPNCIQRWSNASARLVAAAQLAMRNDCTRAMRLVLQAIVDDPLGSGADLRQRLKNAIARTVKGKTVEPFVGWSFWDVSPLDGIHSRIDPLIARRLDSLMAYE